MSAILAAFALTLSIPPVAPAEPGGPCPAPVRGEAERSEELAAQAATAMSAGDRRAAEELAVRGLAAGGGDTARAWAVRTLIDLRLPRGDLAEIEAILGCGASSGEAWTHARAWLAYRQGRFADAVRLLQPLTRPRHHMLPRWSIVHDDLGDAFARLGREADAQAQWRIALATDYDPGHTGWVRAETERKLAAAASRTEGSAPLLPLQYYGDAVSILDVDSVRRTEAGVRFTKLVLLRNVQRGADYGRDSWEVRCDQPEARVLAVHSFTADGAAVRTMSEPRAWQPDLPGEPWLGTERRLVCALEPGLRLAPRARTDAELLRAYRAGQTLFD